MRPKQGSLVSYLDEILGVLLMDLTLGEWDPAFEYIDPSLPATVPQPDSNPAFEKSPGTGLLIPVRTLAGRNAVTQRLYTPVESRRAVAEESY